MKRIVWHENDESIAMAYNTNEEFLGYLKEERLGRFMQWVWYQQVGIRMSAGCLDEVRDKQKEMRTIMANKRFEKISQS